MDVGSTVGYVLLADDDLDDIDILTTALKEVDDRLKVLVAQNGKTVLEQLKAVQDAVAELRPCVLVMDMNMPKMDGRETVVAIKSDEALRHLPILLFSTARNKTDEMFAQKWGVQFLQKPDTVQGLHEVAKVIIGMCREQV